MYFSKTQTLNVAYKSILWYIVVVFGYVKDIVDPGKPQVVTIETSMS